MMLTIKRGDHSCEQIPLLELPLLRESMPQQEYAKIIAKVLVICFKNRLKVPGICYNGTACADLVDGVLLQHPPSCRKAKVKDVPVFSRVTACGEKKNKFCLYQGASFSGEFISSWTSPSRDIP